MKRRYLKLLLSSTLAIPLLLGPVSSPVNAAEEKRLPGKGQAASTVSTSIKVKDGMTQPVFSLDDAILERVFIETTADSDNDGKLDTVRADVIRPKETESGLKVPVIYEMSPYRGGFKDVPLYDVDVELNAVPRKGKQMGEGGKPHSTSIPANLPGYYDDYFVARGYAVVLAESIGTGLSDGCPTIGDENEILGTRAVIDWLNGRAKAKNVEGASVKADWSTGNVGMAGVSYNGTLPNAVATTGIEGLKTIVPIAAISSWYDYYRANGSVVAPGGFQGEDTDNLAGAVLTRKNPEACSKMITQLTEGQDRESGDYNDFWKQRDYTRNAEKVKASVLVVHGLNDWNVKTKHFSDWWLALQKNDVPSKLWLHQGGHSNPYNFRKDAWLTTLNKWFDYWLYGIENNIMEEPKVDIQREDKSWMTEENWPAKETETTKLYLNRSEGQGGGLSIRPAKNRHQESFIDNAQIKAETLAANPMVSSANRLVYRTPPLSHAVRLSGTPIIKLRASIDRPTANLTALLVKYGPTKTEIVTRGWMDSQNLHKESHSLALKPGREYSFKWSMQPDDYVFEAGDQVGIVLLSSDYDYTLRPKAGTKITVDLNSSEINLPIVGGAKAFIK